MLLILRSIWVVLICTLPLGTNWAKAMRGLKIDARFIVLAIISVLLLMADNVMCWWRMGEEDSFFPLYLIFSEILVFIVIEPRLLWVETRVIGSLCLFVLIISVVSLLVFFIYLLAVLLIQHDHLWRWDTAFHVEVKNAH